MGVCVFVRFSAFYITADVLYFKWSSKSSLSSAGSVCVCVCVCVSEWGGGVIYAPVYFSFYTQVNAHARGTHIV